MQTKTHEHIIISSLPTFFIAAANKLARECALTLRNYATSVSYFSQSTTFVSRYLPRQKVSLSYITHVAGYGNHKLLFACKRKPMNILSFHLSPHFSLLLLISSLANARLHCGTTQPLCHTLVHFKVI